MVQPELIEALPDLTLSEAGDRWGVSSANTIKARARALVEALPPLDQAEVDRMHAAAAEALASWGTPPGWDEWG